MIQARGLLKARLPILAPVFCKLEHFISHFAEFYQIFQRKNLHSSAHGIFIVQEQ